MATLGSGKVTLLLMQRIAILSQVPIAWVVAPCRLRRRGALTAQCSSSPKSAKMMQRR